MCRGGTGSTAMRGDGLSIVVTRTGLSTSAESRIPCYTNIHIAQSYVHPLPCPDAVQGEVGL